MPDEKTSYTEKILVFLSQDKNNKQTCLHYFIFPVVLIQKSLLEMHMKKMSEFIDPFPSQLSTPLNCGSHPSVRQ